MLIFDLKRVVFFFRKLQDEHFSFLVYSGSNNCPFIVSKGIDCRFYYRQNCTCGFILGERIASLFGLFI